MSGPGQIDMSTFQPIGGTSPPPAPTPATGIDMSTYQPHQGATQTTPPPGSSPAAQPPAAAPPAPSFMSKVGDAASTALDAVSQDPSIQLAKGAVKTTGQALFGAADILNKIESHVHMPTLGMGTVKPAQPTDPINKFRDWINAPSDSVMESAGGMAGDLGMFMTGEEILDLVGKGPGALAKAAQLEKMLANSPKIAQVLRVGVNVAKDPAMRQGIISAAQAYAKSGGDPKAAQDAFITGAVTSKFGEYTLSNVTPPAQAWLKKYFGPWAQDVLDRMETTATGETVVKPKPAKLSEAQKVELARKSAADQARNQRTESYLQNREAITGTRSAEIEGARATHRQNVSEAEATEQAQKDAANAAHAETVGQAQTAQEQATAEAQQQREQALTQQQQEGQAAIQKSAQDMLASHLEEVNESRRAVQHTDGPPPPITLGLPQQELGAPLPSRVTGEPTDVRTTRTPGQGSQAVPSAEYQGGPEAPHATTYPPARVDQAEGPRGPTETAGTVTLSTNTPADAVKNRAVLTQINDAIHDPSFDQLPVYQQNHLIDLHQKLADQVEQYDRFRAATGNSVRSMFDPINIPDVVKNLGSHMEAADFLHDVVNRGYDELANRGGLIEGGSSNTYQTLKNGYKQAEEAVRGAAGTPALAAAQEAQDAAHQRLVKFFENDVNVSPAEVAQLNLSYKNYLVMRDVGQEISSAFERNPYMAKDSTAYNNYTGDGLDKALTRLANKHGYAQLQRVMGADNLRTLQEVAIRTKTVEGSKELATATDAIGKEYARIVDEAGAQRDAAIKAAKAASGQTVDEEATRLAEATRAAQEKYRNAIGPARRQFNQEVLAAKAAEREHAASAKAQALKKQITTYGFHAGGTSIAMGAGATLGHFTGIPGGTYYGAGVGAIGYQGARLASAKVWNAMTSNPAIAKSVMYAIDHEIPVSTYAQAIARNMAKTASNAAMQNAVDDTRQRQQQQQQQGAQ